MVMLLMHIDQLDTLYKSYTSKNSSGVIWGLSTLYPILSTLCLLFVPEDEELYLLETLVVLSRGEQSNMKWIRV